MIRRILAAALGVGLCLCFWLSSAGLSHNSLAIATGRGGAVATVDADATRIGLEVLRHGGNAVDAAVSAAAALGVTDHFSTDIGGGGFMVIYLRDHEGEVMKTLVKYLPRT